MWILLGQDERRTARAILRAFEHEGYLVDVCADGDAALHHGTKNDYDAVILDVTLPSRDGLSVCRELRNRSSWVPILMLAEHDAVGGRIGGRDAGADDVLVKPFALGELLARVRAQIGQRATDRSSVLRLDDVVLDPAAFSVSRSGRVVTLSPREFLLLEFLLRHPGEIVTRAQILDQVWDYDYGGSSNVVDVYVGYLRRKLEKPFDRPFIETVRGVGYRTGES